MLNSYTYTLETVIQAGRKNMAITSVPIRTNRDLRPSRLVKSPAHKFYVFLVEQGKEAEFDEYLTAEQHTIVCWLDNDADLEALERGSAG